MHQFQTLGKKYQQYCHGQQKPLLIHELEVSFPNASVLPTHSPTPASPQRNENSETDYIYLYFVQICAQKQHGAGFSLRPPSMENIPHSCYSSGHIPMSHSSLRALAPSSTAWRQSSPQEVLHGSTPSTLGKSICSGGWKYTRLTPKVLQTNGT